MAEVSYTIATQLAARLASLTLDTTQLATGAHVPAQLVHDTTSSIPRDPRDVVATQFRRFWIEAPTTEDPGERGAFNWSNEHIRKSFEVTIAYYGANVNRLRVECVASDDLDRIVRGVKRGIGDYTAPTGAAWIQVDPEDGGFVYDEQSGGALRSLTIHVEYQRTY